MYTEQIQAVHYKRKDTVSRTAADLFGEEMTRKVRAYHRSFPEYDRTPLVSLQALAEHLHTGSIYVKDESRRFGLNAFKVLGGSYGIGCVIAKRLGTDITQLSCDKLVSPAVREKLGQLTFITATDGNHGRGIAWTANRLRQKSVVYMPAGSAPERLRNIQALGADAEITDLNYDDTVRLAQRRAEENGWILTQDTAWEGYEQIPEWIMEGYVTMADEALEQLDGVMPTHIFLQAGVGSMAAAVSGYFAARCPAGARPVITIVEPDAADCIYRTAKANDGKLHCVQGHMHSMMAGLCCGEPSVTAWDILKDCADHFISMPDYVAARGMRILANPLPGDAGIISGESGASAFGLVTEVLRNPSLKDLKESLELDENSRILCFSTEGATDRENYRRVVWDGINRTVH